MDRRSAPNTSAPARAHRLIRVDHDPFAPHQAPGPRLIPVDHDPFAASPQAAPKAPRVINFEGRRIQVPHDATDEEVISILEAGPKSPPQVPSTARAGIVEINAPDGSIVEFPAGTSEDVMNAAMRARFGGPTPPAQQSRQPFDPLRALIERTKTETSAPFHTTPENQRNPDALAEAGHGLMLGTQSVGRGLANLAGFLPDVAAIGLNAGISGVDRAAEAAGGNVDFRFDIPSETIKLTSSRIAESLGLPLAEPRNFQEKALNSAIEFGTEGLGGGAALARAAGPRAFLRAGTSATPRIADALINAYNRNPSKTVAGDAIAGAGAGSTLALSREVPEDIRSEGNGIAGVLLDLAAMGVGGVGGGTAFEVATNTPASVVRRFKDARPASGITLDPETGMPVSNGIADKAASFVQGQAIDPELAASNILANAESFRSEGLPLPTTGLTSGDVGLEALDRGQRTRQSTGTLFPSADVDPATKAQYSFGARDNALRDSAVDSVTGIRPDGADPNLFVERAGEITDARRDVAQRGVDQAQGAQRGVDLARREPAAELNATVGQGAGASRNIDEMFRETRSGELKQNRELFNAPELTAAEVPVQPLQQVANELAALDTPRAPLDPVVRKYVDRFAAESDTPFTMREVGANKAEIEADIQSNLANGEVVRQLRSIKDGLKSYADPLAQTDPVAAEAARVANQNHAERIGPNFRKGAGGFEDAALKKDRTGYSTRPSETAETFLTRPEDAEDLMRISRLRGNEEATAADARTWLFDRLASTGVAKNGAIDAAQITKWRNANSDLLSKVPGLKAEVDDMVTQARRGEVLSEQAASGLRQAGERLRGVEGANSKSILGKINGEAPDKAIGRVFGGRNPEADMDELVKTVGRAGQKQEGMKSLKAAVSDYFTGKVAGVNPANVTEGSQTINYATLVKEFNRSEKALAKVFLPDEMDALRRAQKVLEPLAKRQGQATSGSVTAESARQTWDVIETGMKAWYGVLKGGGVTRTLKLAAKAFKGDDVEQANRLVARMMFDPELAAHLLTRNVAKGGDPAWNTRLQKIIRRTEAFSGAYDDKEQ